MSDLKLYGMKGLKKYTQKHGSHFTERLALDASRRFIDDPWGMDDVQGMLERKVYYNAVGMTNGDILYVANVIRYQMGEDATKARCVRMLVDVLQGTGHVEGMAFSAWISGMEFNADGFDLSPYI